jgi:hypothetical protein
MRTNRNQNLALAATERKSPHAVARVRTGALRCASVDAATLARPARMLESARRAPLTSALLALWGAVNARYGAAVALPLLRAADKRAVAIREEN